MKQGENDLFRTVIDYCSDAVVIIDKNGIVEFLNPAAERLFGRSSEKIIGQMFEFPVTNDKPKELNIFRKGKGLCVTQTRIIKIEFKGEILHVGVLRDITELEKLREEFRTMLLVDNLTGLYSRRGFLTLAQQQLKMVNRTKKKMFLIFINLGSQKEIDDVLNQQKNDLILIEIANILKETFRDSDIIARIGEDEFTVLAIKAHKDDVEIINTRLQKNLETTYHTKKDKHSKLSINIHTTCYDPKYPCSIDELLNQQMS